jgi:hypothetical protein
MNSVYRKSNTSITKSAYFKIKPAFRISFVLCSHRIVSSPKSVVIVTDFNHLLHISRIEVAIEENRSLARFRERNIIPLWKLCFFGWYFDDLFVLHMKNCCNKIYQCHITILHQSYIHLNDILYIIMNKH